jgi:SAM-dependent methyltransferase
MDWSVGRYERVAAQLLPAASVLVDRAAPAPGERVLDVGCGTGNAALLASERGASATGIDPAERLLDVARTRASERGLAATFLRGEAEALPLADAAADVVVSVFGVIFASDAQPAAAEIGRVASPSGRFALSAWVPEGGLFDVMRARGEATAAATQAPPAPVSFPWHDSAALNELFADEGFSITVEEQRLQFTAASPQQFLDAEFRDHPAWIASLDLLEAHGTAQPLRERVQEIVQAANEDRDAFCLTSRYVVAIGRRA